MSRSTPSTACCGLLRCRRSQCGVARHSRHQRLRIRIPDGADESQNPARCGDGVHDAGGKVLVPQLAAWCAKSRSSADRSQVWFRNWSKRNFGEKVCRTNSRTRCSRSRLSKEAEIMTTTGTQLCLIPDRPHQPHRALRDHGGGRRGGEARASGVDVVDFGAGEPHFSTPQHIKEPPSPPSRRISRSTPRSGGTAELRDAIMHRHAVDFDSGLPA